MNLLGRVVTDFLTFLGVTNGSGRWYLWWSGIVGDIGLFGGGYLIMRKHNCHVHRCWRFGHHAWTDENGVVRQVCAHHHPDLGKHHRLLPHHLIKRS